MHELVQLPFSAPASRDLGVVGLAKLLLALRSSFLFVHYFVVVRSKHIFVDHHQNEGHEQSICNGTFMIVTLPAGPREAFLLRIRRLGFLVSRQTQVL